MINKYYVKENLKKDSELPWDELDRRVRFVGATSKEQLWKMLHQVWDNIPANTLRKLVERIPGITEAAESKRVDIWMKQKFKTFINK